MANPLVLYVLALFEAAILAEKQGYSTVWFEGDAKSIIDSINSKSWKDTEVRRVKERHCLFGPLLHF